MDSKVDRMITSLASLASCCMLASPAVTMRELQAKSSIGVMKVTFFCAQMLNCVTWGFYGVLVWNIPLIVAEFLGTAVTTYCILTFMTVARREFSVKGELANTTPREISLYVTVTAAATGFFTVACILLQAYSFELTVNLIGLSGTAATIAMLSSPLELLGKIIRTKNADGLAPVTMASAFVCCSLWFISGIIRMDPYMIVSNLVGIISPLIQLAFLIKYGRRPKQAVHIPYAVAAVPALAL